MRLLVLLPWLLALALCACLKASPPSGSRVGIAIAPLELPGLSNVCYDLRVTNAPDGAGTVVWSKGDSAVDGVTDPDSVCSSRFGNSGGGAITFVGACDATPVNAGDVGRTNSVTIWVDSLFALGGAQILENGGDGWRDPCPGGCTLNTSCQENTDAKVEFNLTILRQANQGFFDIGVNFDDIFCSAKVDCRGPDGGPLKLLFNTSGVRDTTIVSALACTTGPGEGTRTFLYRNPLVISCSAGSTTLSASTQKGNAYATSSPDPFPLDPVWQYAVYLGSESLTCGVEPCNKLYWNIAFGLDATFDNCTLKTRMTAAREGVMNVLSTPSSTTYPYIDVELALTDTEGLVCDRHAVNDPNDPKKAVITRYTSFTSPVSFSRAYASGLVDECVLGTDNCHANATCTDLVVGFSCACNSGYSGTGDSCTEINECATNNGGCSANATCTNTPGSFSCACNSGYTGNGVTCTDINECATANGGCSVNATCANTLGGHTCVCNEGYVGDGVTCIQPTLSSISPTISRVGDTLTLWGNFVSPLIVNFPGGGSVAATVLGTGRATVVVPSGATSGSLSITAGGTTTPGVPFQMRGYTLGLSAGMPMLNDDQSAYARQAATLVTARKGHASVVIGPYVYVVGGEGTSPLATIERAIINADGTLSAFATVPNVTLVVARAWHACVVNGSYLYVLGGKGTTALASVERAAIQANGSLGAFETVSGSTLVTARHGLTSHVIGSYLYVVGGESDASVLNTLERAPLGADGSMGAFSAVSGVNLATARRGHTSEVVGAFLYVMGGHNGLTLQNTVERAELTTSGGVGPFATMNGVTLTAREKATSVLLGDSLYVLGGEDTSGKSSAVLKATWSSGGGLSSFTPISSYNLVVARSGASGLVVGHHLLLIGGGGSSGALATIERLSINASGNLGAFATYSRSLDVGRAGFALAVIGKYLYVFGGRTTGGMWDLWPSGVSRATVAADGTLGDFANVPGLSVGRYRPNAVIIGNKLYLVGGSINSYMDVSTSTLVSTIDSEGNLSALTDAGVNVTGGSYGISSVVVGNRLHSVVGRRGAYNYNERHTWRITDEGTLADGVVYTYGFGDTSGSLYWWGRSMFSSVLIGQGFYTFGGNNSGNNGAGNGYYSHSESSRLVLNADGTFNSVQNTAAACSLILPSWGHTSLTLGDYVYTAGGIFRAANNMGQPFIALPYVQRAPISSADGTLATFADTGVSLPEARYDHGMIVLGNDVYVLGGWASSTSAIARAPMQ